jgi:hypothetical protein
MGGGQILVHMWKCFLIVLGLSHQDKGKRDIFATCAVGNRRFLVV